MTRLSIITTATRGLCRHLSATASCAVIVDHLTLVEATNHSNSTYVSRDAKFLMEYRSIYNSVAYSSPQTSLARFYICAVAQLERPQPSDTHLPRYQHWTSDFLPRGYLGACSWADRPLDHSNARLRRVSHSPLKTCWRQEQHSSSQLAPRTS